MIQGEVCALTVSLSRQATAFKAVVGLTCHRRSQSKGEDEEDDELYHGQDVRLLRKERHDDERREERLKEATKGGREKKEVSVQGKSSLSPNGPKRVRSGEWP